MNGGSEDMSEKDSAIKLFGWKIPLPECQIHTPSQIPANSQLMDTSSVRQKPDVNHLSENASMEQGNCTRLGGDMKNEDRTSVQVNEKGKPDSNGSDQDKIFKKPDKVLQCPRCNSLDTKFCYFNNYNVNQPRHFCKICHRYWTAGGTMRNVPVGAGRRKNKHLASQYRQIIVSSDVVPSTRSEITDSNEQQAITCLEASATLRSTTGNGMSVLKFGPEVPLCDSMENMLNLGGSKGCLAMIPDTHAETKEETSLCVSSTTTASNQGNELLERSMQREQAVPDELNASHTLQYYPVPPQGFPWNPGRNAVTSTATAQHSDHITNINASASTPVQWYPTPMLASPGICPPSIPFQFIPAPYWGGMPVWAAGMGSAWNVSSACLSPTSSTGNSGNGSPTLGKHSRDCNYTNEEKTEKCVFVPKTLRIDDPNESSRSPIWSTLGIETDKSESVSKDTAGLKMVKTKSEGNSHALGPSQILEANPAAVSRAHAFQESS